MYSWFSSRIMIIIGINISISICMRSDISISISICISFCINKSISVSSYVSMSKYICIAINIDISIDIFCFFNVYTFRLYCQYPYWSLFLLSRYWSSVCMDRSVNVEYSICTKVFLRVGNENIQIKQKSSIWLLVKI